MLDKQKLVLNLLLIIVGITISILIFAWLKSNERSNAQIRSIFDEDTCAPPCWFGLTPGVSTAQDAITLLLSRNDIFLGANPVSGGTPAPYGELDAQNGYVLDGEYRFRMINPEGWLRPDEPIAQEYDLITIRDGYVSVIAVEVDDYITLGEVLNTLGMPNHIHFFYVTDDPEDRIRLDLIYIEPLFRVGLYASPSDCTIATLQQNFWTERLVYFSSESANLPIQMFDVRQLQPSLFAHNLGDRDVPQDTWQIWLNGEVNMSCEEAYEQLSEEPTYPTVMPTATFSE